MAASVAEWDVAVVGAGPAGSATALRLARAGCRVALLEGSRFDAPRIGESLPPGVQPLLTELGVWQWFLGLGALPSYGTRSIWGRAEAEEHSHLMSPWGSGWHVDRLAFDVLLSERARDAGAALLCGITLIHCDRVRQGWALSLLTDRPQAAPLDLRARVLVDATGRGAHVAQRLGARRILADHLVAVVTRFDQIESGEQGYVMVEATPEGWWYSAPVPERRMVVALMTDGDLYGRARAGSASAWQDRWERAGATCARVAGGARSGEPRVVSAVSQRLRRRERGEPWLAVGDAALSVDPISGSGVVRALRSARAAAQAVVSMLQGSGPASIAAYEDACDREWSAYGTERALYYGFEQRWAGSVFWQRRAPAPGESPWPGAMGEDPPQPLRPPGGTAGSGRS